MRKGLPGVYRMHTRMGYVPVHSAGNVTSGEDCRMGNRPLVAIDGYETFIVYAQSAFARPFGGTRPKRSNDTVDRFQ